MTFIVFGWFCFKTIFKGDIFNVGNQGQHPVYRYAKPLWMEV